MVFKIEKKELPLIFSRVIRAGIDPYLMQKKTAAVFGLGGLGILVSEMLVRTGIGKLIIVDRDVVGEENLNRLGYSSEDLNKPKVKVASIKLKTLATARGSSFPLEIESYTVDIIGWEKLPEIVQKSDVIFTCLDNLAARLEVNYWAIKKGVPLIDGGTSLNGLRGRVITVIPYKTPCIGCYYDPTTLKDIDLEENIAACGASLPTVMSIVAALQAHIGISILHGKNREIVPRIFINLEHGINFVLDVNVKRRRNCPFCGTQR